MDGARLPTELLPTELFAAFAFGELDIFSRRLVIAYAVSLVVIRLHCPPALDGGSKVARSVGPPCGHEDHIFLGTNDEMGSCRSVAVRNAASTRGTECCAMYRSCSDWLCVDTMELRYHSD
jgi:hypothetical protein